MLHSARHDACSSSRQHKDDDIKRNAPLDARFCPNGGEGNRAYRKSMRSAISDASTGAGGCVRLPKTSTITPKRTDRVYGQIKDSGQIG